VIELAEIQRRSYAAARGVRSSWPEEDALDQAGLADLLGRHRYCVLATGRPDRRATAAPVAFVAHGGSFWFATVEGLRLRNLRSTPWASIVVMEGGGVDGGGPEHRAVTAEGPTVLYEGDEFARTFEPLREAWLARHRRPPDWAAALVELQPERLFSYAAHS
jgi:nitroimidazol reductase NimA-like FMN-containing flavoprotein (pyridoxamine 5'-phosphate oxidase superfamily)